MSGIFAEIGKIFGGGDAVDAAVGRVQQRTHQAIDLINDRTDLSREGLDKRFTESINTLSDSLSRVTSLIVNANDEQMDLLREGGTERLKILTDSEGQQREDLAKAGQLAFDELKEGGEDAFATLQEGFERSSNEIRNSRDDSLGVLRTSLSNSLRKIGEGTTAASNEVRQSFGRIQQNLQPFVDVGQDSVRRASELINDPTAQVDFIKNNPFFKAITDKTREDLLANKAAKGRVGSGEVALELQDQFMRHANDLIGTNVNQNLALGGLGLQAGSTLGQMDMESATRLANIIQTGAGQEATLESQFGRDASGVMMGAGNTIADLTRFFSGAGANVQMQTGSNIANLLATMGPQFNRITETGAANRANVIGETATNMTNVIGSNARTIADVDTRLSGGMAAALQQLGITDTSVIQGANSNIANMLLNMGNTEAQGDIAGNNADMQGFNSLLDVAALVMGMPTGGGTSSGGGGVASFTPTTISDVGFNVPIPTTPTLPAGLGG